MSDVDPRLQEAVAKAARRLAVPVGLVMGIREGQPLLWAETGLPETLPGEALQALQAMLAPALVDPGLPVVIPNTAEHPQWRGHPLLVRHGIQFVAAHPVSGASAAVCAIDFRPRHWSPGEAALLALFTRLASEPFEPASLRSIPATDGETGAYTEDFFLQLCIAELRTGASACLVVCEIEKLDAIRAERGDAVASRLLVKLAEILKARTRTVDSVGRLAKDRIGIWLPATPGESAPAVEAKLRERLREEFRFATRVGAVGPARTFADMLRGAEASLQAPRAAPAKSAPQGTGWEQRYQRLVLLHRLALAVSAARSFESALVEAGQHALALANAKYLSIRFRDDSGRLATAHAHGDAVFSSAAAKAKEEKLVADALAAGAPDLWHGDTELGCLAVPIPGADAASASSGIAVLGYLDGAQPEEDVRQVLREVALLLRNAHMADRQSREQKILAAVTEQSADPLIVTDMDGRVTSWSRGAEETFGYPSAGVLGRKLVDFFIPEDQLEGHRQALERAVAEGSSRALEEQRLAKDGRRVPVESTFTVIRDQLGKPFRLVRLLRDITKRKEIDRLKAEFMTLVTHELRTPLTSIRGFSDTLIEYWGKLPEDQSRRYLRIILEESKRLGRLVNDFLDTSRLESGGVALELERVDLRALAERVAAVFQGHHSGVVFRIEVDAAIPQPLADEDQVQRVLVNLCGNAVKYSPDGGTVTIEADVADGRVRVRVSDQGPGISPENRRQLFQKFYRVNDAVAMKTPGTGLGLYIAKAIVDAHGGRIWVDPSKGRGTRFAFDLPLDGPPPGPRPAPEAPASPPPAR